MKGFTSLKTILKSIVLVCCCCLALTSCAGTRLELEHNYDGAVHISTEI